MNILNLYPASTNPVREEAASRQWMPPGGLLEVAGMTPGGFEVELWNELTRGQIRPADLLGKDLVAISSLSTSRLGGYRVADLCREIGIPVVGGGIDITAHSSEGYSAEILAHYDNIVVGRLTENLWKTVINDSLAGNKQCIYRAGTNELFAEVLPRHDLVNPSEYFAPAVVRSSAGCLERCPFCAAHMVIGARGVVHTKPINLLKEELRILPPAKFLVDASDSFGCDIGHTYMVLDAYADRGKPWFTEITIKNLLGIGAGRSPLIQPMADSGCVGVYIGVESIHEKTGGKSLDLPQVEEAIRLVHEAGMFVAVSLILDVSGKETMESIRQTMDWLEKMRVDAVQMSLTALLPGSKSREVCIANNRLIDNNPEHLDGGWPTMEHQMSPRQRIELLSNCYKRFYSFASMWKRLDHTPNRRQRQVWAVNIAINHSHRGYRRGDLVGYYKRTRQDYAPPPAP